MTNSFITTVRIIAFSAFALSSAGMAAGFECPPGTDLSGQAPPLGFSQDCLTPEGFREGPSKAWYSNGKPRHEGNYRNDHGHGKFSGWYESGNKRAEGSYVDGKMEGPWIRWFDNGQMDSQGNWHDGVPTGSWTLWNRDGSVFKSGEYVDGALVSGPGKKRLVWKSLYASGLVLLQNSQFDLFTAQFGWQPQYQLSDRIKLLGRLGLFPLRQSQTNGFFLGGTYEILLSYLVFHELGIELGGGGQTWMGLGTSLFLSAGIFWRSLFLDYSATNMDSYQTTEIRFGLNYQFSP